MEAVAGFFVRPDGTVVGPACVVSGIYLTNIEEIGAILWPPTTLKHYRHFDAYTWLPDTRRHELATESSEPRVEMRLALSVDKDGFVLGWN